MHRLPLRHWAAAFAGLIALLASTTESTGAGCAWQSVAMIPLQAPASVASISAASPDDVWAVGSYVRASGFEHSFAEQFNGSVWNVFPVSGVDLGAVRAFSKSDAWAVGTKSVGGFIRTLALHYDGTAWDSVPTPNANNSEDILDAMAGTSSSDLWAVGSYFDPNTHATLALAEHWNGRAWSLVPTPDVDLQNKLLGVYAAAPNDVWAVGYHDNVGGTNGGVLIEHWNGSRWRVATAPNTPFVAFSALNAAGGSSPTDVWAVGTGFSDMNSQSATLTEHWDGVRWTYVQSPNVGTQDNVLDGVVSDDIGRAVAVGSSAAGNSTLVERWNGRAWRVDGTALSPKFSRLNAVSFSNDEFWAGGSAGKRPYDESDCEGRN